jgi:hypothetical protein
MTEDSARVPRASIGLLVLGCLWRQAAADGLIVDKVYDPYVQPLEKELEFRTLVQYDDDLPDVQRHSLGFGKALGERWFAEIYAIALKSAGESLHIDTYEVEIKRQLTEQGEFAVDWGLLFELEREADVDIWEFSSSVLMAKEVGNWTAMANVDFIYEWGGPIDDEFEMALHTQLRRRWREGLEPGLEIHIGQDTTAIGPVFSGLRRINVGNKLRWELGYFTGLDDATADHTLRLSIEYEFL